MPGNLIFTFVSFLAPKAPVQTSKWDPLFKHDDNKKSYMLERSWVLITLVWASVKIALIIKCFYLRPKTSRLEFRCFLWVCVSPARAPDFLTVAVNRAILSINLCVVIVIHGS